MHKDTNVSAKAKSKGENAAIHETSEVHTSLLTLTTSRQMYNSFEKSTN